MMEREKFYELEKKLLYLYCGMFFIKYEILKVFIIPMVLIILLRRFFYGEKLNCGNEKLKKFLLILVVGGMIWNFLANFDYRSARAFFKISREIVLPFYIYPIVSRENRVIEGVVKALTLSFLIMAGKTFHNYLDFPGKNGATGFEWVGTTRAMALMASSMSLGGMFSRNSNKIKALSLFVFVLGVGTMIMSNSRAGLVALGGSILCTFLISRVDLRKIVVIVMVLGVIAFITPSNRTKHFKTTFNSEKTIKNFSNGMRIELWKNAIWRIEQHPVMGSGTKNDEKLFKKYANNLPEETKVDRFYKKKMLNSGFNDAHNMYLNIVSDNGVFSIIHLILIFGVLPCLCFKNLKITNSINRSVSLGVSASLVSFYIYGMFWSIWRGDWSRTEFWFLVSLLCCMSFFENDVEKHS